MEIRGNAMMSEPSIADLKEFKCLEKIDSVPKDSEMTAFKRTARLHQAKWRVSRIYPVGTQPYIPNPDKPSRHLGSRIESEFAMSKGVNFLTDSIRDAIKHRISNPEKGQMLRVDRLYCDLLSSMPMCFNLFGEFYDNPKLATRAITTICSDAPIHSVDEPRFEWSPGRADPRYLGNRSAFDVAFETRTKDGLRGVVGIETKYHEDCKKEDPITEVRKARYIEVSKRSKAFKDGAIDKIINSELQQIWQDHLLLLSMLQQDPALWYWGKFILVAPEKNSSFKSAATEYLSLLEDDSTFGYLTIESIIDQNILPTETSKLFRERYLW
jgi:hypothetical protein